jgi:hypothetical protein
MRTLEKISYLQIIHVCIFTLLLIASGCIKEDDDDILPDEPIELTGSQSSPIVLTNRISNPAIPDYFVTAQWDVTAAVTIEPGVFIQMKAGASIHVSESGSMKAIGTQSDKIVFRGESPTPGYWDYLLFTSNNIDNQLEHVSIEYGGGNTSWDAAVYGWSNGRLRMSNTLISNSGSNGLLIGSDEFNLDAFSYNNFQNNNEAPIQIQANQIDKMDGETTFSGNGVNRIEVAYSNLTQNKSIRKTQVPYFIISDFDVNSAVEIQPGVTFLMGANSGIRITENGSLKAIGTPTERITITGAQETKGFWHDLRFNGSNNVNNEFQFVDVNYGGGNSSWDASIYLWNGALFRMGNSSVRNSQSWGIMVGNSTFNDDGNNSFSGNVSGNIGN